MRSFELPAPGLLFGPYPERRIDTEAGWPQTLARWLSGCAPERSRRATKNFLTSVHRHADRYAQADSLALDAALSRLRGQLRREGFTDAVVAEAFAVIREVAGRQLNLRHYDSQLIAGRVMLHNRLAEMHTGEGKTLTALLTVATAALAGIPVHVITANDYLARRDAEFLKPVYAALGLQVGYIVQPLEAPARRAAYACAVTYTTARELVFDYLRDRLVLGGHPDKLRLRAQQMRPQAPLLLRGLCMALVDEADCILIDEARTPAILAVSRVDSGLQTMYHQALQIARQLWRNQDFRMDSATRAAQLTERGIVKMNLLADPLGGLWKNTRQRHELTSQALSALHGYQRDRDYLVRSGKVEIIDAHSGRAAPGRTWSRGLHPLIEIKENCTPSGAQEPVTQISYQRFFPRYHRLCGMSGTLWEARGELRTTYGLGISRIPLHRPCRRIQSVPQIYVDEDKQWRAIIRTIETQRASSRAVLVGTATVAESEYLSARLDAAKIPHTVLNARNDADEAAIIARAGQPGQVTVATNRAGRGTDIVLDDRVRQSGGLHVIASHINSSRRIDRQLFGRSARQGDPGSAQKILCLNDPLLQRHMPARLLAGLRRYFRNGQKLPYTLTLTLSTWLQRNEEMQQWWQRRVLCRNDRAIERQFSVGRRGA